MVYLDLFSGIGILNNLELEIMVAGIYNATGEDSLPRQLAKIIFG